MKHFLTGAFISAMLSLFTQPLVLQAQQAQLQAPSSYPVLCVTAQGFKQIPLFTRTHLILSIYDGEKVILSGQISKEVCVTARSHGSILRLVFERGGKRIASTKITLTGQGMDVAIAQSDNGDALTIHYAPRSSPQPKKKSE